MNSAPADVPGATRAGPNVAGPLIPREVLFGNPDRVAVGLSPDGRYISFVAPVDGVLNIWVAPADNIDGARPITHDAHRGIRQHFWAFTSQHIIYLQDKDGDENWHIFCVDVSTGAARDLTPLPGIQARIQAVSPKFPTELLIRLNDRNPQLHDIYRVDLETGARRLVLENDGFVNFIADDDFQVRFAQRTTPDGGTEIMQRTTDGGWSSFARVGPEDNLTTSPAGFDKTGQVLYLVDSRGRNTAALTTIDLKSGKQAILAADPRADISGVLAHPTEKTVQAVAFTVQRKQWKILDQSIAADLAYLKTVADGDFEITDRTLDDQHWIVVYLLDDGPAKYYRYDRAARRAQFLCTDRKALEGVALAKMHAVTIKARDGLDLVSYLTLPPASDPTGSGKPGQPVPLVLYVHGGPWARDNWGYSAMHQWLANRGYGVLSVNFRGSTGLGKDFINAADHEWAGKMHDDLIDAVRWAIDQKIADPAKVAILGGSYGGYATLVGLTFTPDVFACGVDIVGPSNLQTLMETMPAYWRPQAEVYAKRIGDHRTEEGRKFLHSRSPLTYVERIQRPLLIGQGANDPRVKQAEADQIVAAMQARKIPVTYVLFPDEGHGFARPENRLAFNAIAEAFLGAHLGGRIEPIGADFKGSTVTVPAGAEQVEGLKTALHPTPAPADAATASATPDELEQRFVAAYQAGDYARALDAAQQMRAALEPRYIAALYNIACMHSRLNQTEEAFTWLTKAVDAGFASYQQMKQDEDLTSLRTDERFRVLCKRAWSRGYITMLERPERAEFQKPEQVMAALAFKPGERVADIGAGSGYFTIPVARAVGSKGVVWALDIEQLMLDYLTKRLEAEHVTNVQMRLVPKDDPQLAAGSVDTILMVDTLHYVKDRAAYAQKLRAALAPGGRVVVIDYIPKPVSERPWGPPPEQQFSRAVIDADLATAGLKPAKVHEFLPEQYFVEYKAE